MKNWTYVDLVWSFEKDATWEIYRLKFEPFAAVWQHGGRLVFKSLTGRAEIWLDQKLIGRKGLFPGAPLTVEMPPGAGRRVLSVLLESGGNPAGMDGPISIIGS